MTEDLASTQLHEGVHQYLKSRLGFTSRFCHRSNQFEHEYCSVLSICLVGHMTECSFGCGALRTGGWRKARARLGLPVPRRYEKDWFLFKEGLPLEIRDVRRESAPDPRFGFASPMSCSRGDGS